MDPQLEGFLNLFGEAERAGGRILHQLTDHASSLELREMLADGHRVNIGALEDALKKGLA